MTNDPVLLLVFYDGVFSAASVEGESSVVFAFAQTVGREKLLHREADAAEKGTRVLVAGYTRAFFVGQTVIVGGNEKLGIPLEADDAELTKSYKPAPCRVTEQKPFWEGSGDKLGYGPLLGLGGNKTLGIHKLAVQCYWVDRIYHRCGHVVCPHEGKNTFGREVFDSALTAEKHNSLVEYRQTHAGLTGGEGLAGNFVEVGAVYCVITAVEAHRGHINVHIQKLGRLGAYAQSVFYVGLRSDRGINPQIVNTVLVTAAVEYLLCIDAYGFTDVCRAFHRPGYNSVGHRNTSCCLD